jgi:hypothetical protein
MVRVGRCLPVTSRGRKRFDGARDPEQEVSGVLYETGRRDRPILDSIQAVPGAAITAVVGRGGAEQGTRIADFDDSSYRARNRRARRAVRKRNRRTAIGIALLLSFAPGAWSRPMHMMESFPAA